MASSTATTLDSVSPALVQQFTDLCETTREIKGVEKESSREYDIQELGVKVLVTMRRLAIEIPKGVAICGGKFSTDTAEVSISPANEKVAQAVSEHFKNQACLSWGMMPQMLQFNKVTINDQAVVLDSKAVKEIDK